MSVTIVNIPPGFRIPSQSPTVSIDIEHVKSILQLLFLSFRQFPAMIADRAALLLALGEERPERVLALASSKFHHDANG